MKFSYERDQNSHNKFFLICNQKIRMAQMDPNKQLMQTKSKGIENDEIDEFAQAYNPLPTQKS